MALLTVILLAIVFVETSLIVLVGAFLKFFIFEDTTQREKPDRRHVKKKRSASRVLRGPPPISAATILSKIAYNTNHRPESLNWFNVLVAQAFAQFREDAQSKDAILISLDTILNGDRRPEFLGPIKITEINMGEEFPIFSNCAIDLNEEQRLHATMDIDLSDTITLAIETSLILNYPSPSFVVLPVALGVTIVRFAGTLSVAFIPPADQTTSTTMTFALRPDFVLDLSIRSLIGSRSRLQDLSKISQLIEGRLRQWLCDRVVEPRYQRIDVPSLWPSKSRTTAKSVVMTEPGDDLSKHTTASLPSVSSPLRRRPVSRS